MGAEAVIANADEFRDELEIKAPHLWEILKDRISELLHNAGRRKVQS